MNVKTSLPPVVATERAHERGERMARPLVAGAAPTPSGCRGHPANGMNRIAIVIPCHRVINKNADSAGTGVG